jgi:flagellar biosynthesis chaperone FliJ
MASGRGYRFDELLTLRRAERERAERALTESGAAVEAAERRVQSLEQQLAEVRDGAAPAARAGTESGAELRRAGAYAARRAEQARRLAAELEAARGERARARAREQAARGALATALGREKALERDRERSLRSARRTAERREGQDG